VGKVDVAAFRERLLAERDELLHTGSERLAPNRTDVSASKDDDSQPLNEMHQAIASARNRDRAVRLGRIAAALGRISEDPEEFGICGECDRDIPERRLALMPWVTVCVPCQEALEAPPGGGGRKTRRKLTDHV
jgi:DnaK suppressor protein